MALFDSTDFSTYTVDVPSSEAGNTLTDNGNVSIIKSDGSTQIVFNSLETALKCLNFMNARNQYYIIAGDDITIVNCQTKLLILENTFINQKMLNSYVFSYHGKKIIGINRNLSKMMNLTDALSSVGFKVNSNTPFNTNLDLETNLSESDRPRVKVIDWFYFTSQGSMLSDTSQIIFS